MVTEGAEVKSGTTNVPITCTISDVTSTPTVTWSDGVNSISNGADYAVGTVTLTGTIARAVLTVQKESTATTAYTCLVTSTEWSKTDDPHSVDLKVYGKYIQSYRHQICYFEMRVNEMLAIVALYYN